MTKKTKPDIVTAMSHPRLFKSWFEGQSWDGWRAVLKGAYALPMSPSEIEFFRLVAERDPPPRRVRELWCVVGRRGGKDAIASLITAHAATFFDGQDKLRRGERALCLCLACDREQSKVLLNYCRSYFADIPPLAAMVRRETANGFELTNGVDVTIATNDFRSVRGRAILSCTLDEVAFYKSENSSAPDVETYNAVVPGTVTLPGSMVIGISSPYRQSGLLFDKFTKHYAKNDDDVLVIRAPSATLNPTLDQKFIDAQVAADPAAARAEWLAEWRGDIESFVTREAIDQCTVPGRLELLPSGSSRYVAFCDPSGGSSDSMTLAIAHTDIWSEKAVLDALREAKPPFSPDAIVAEFAALLRAYGVTRVIGDHYGGEWPRERFRLHGITYETSDRSKSELALTLLPLLNSAKCELLDVPRLSQQLLSWERKTSRSGRDSVDHARGSHDDLATVAAGSIVVCHERGAGPVCGAIGVPSRFRATPYYSDEDEWKRISAFVCCKPPTAIT